MARSKKPFGKETVTFYCYLLVKGDRKGHYSLSEDALERLLECTPYLEQEGFEIRKAKAEVECYTRETRGGKEWKFNDIEIFPSVYEGELRCAAFALADEWNIID